VSYWIATYLAVLVALTLFAGWKWYTMRGTSVSPAERQVFVRFILGIAVFWLLIVGMYFSEPLLSALKSR
jgi:uncharacterized membrane protein